MGFFQQYTVNSVVDAYTELLPTDTHTFISAFYGFEDQGSITSDAPDLSPS